MADIVIYGHIYYFPPELLRNIFIYLPAKDLNTCRLVHPYWKLVVDDLDNNVNLWRRNCKDDFRSLYLAARKKAKPGLTWYSLYRSLTLWKQLRVSKEDHTEFAPAFRPAQEIRNFKILSEGMIGVLKRGSIVYYDVDTLAISSRHAIVGDYSKYTENDKCIVILSYQLHLFVIRKFTIDENGEEDHSVTYDNVKLFILRGHRLFFVNLNDEIFVLDLRPRKLIAIPIARSDDGIMSIGFKYGFLNVLTFQREIFTVKKDDFILRCTIGPKTNILDQVQRYNLLDLLDWRVYFQWMHALNHNIPDGPLRDIIIVKSYGHVYFIGTNWGVLRIYYAPYKNGELDIFGSKPIKQYHFIEQCDIPVLCMCPILQIDVVEVDDGHTVILAMPKKIAVLHYSHNFDNEISVTETSIPEDSWDIPDTLKSPRDWINMCTLKRTRRMDAARSRGTRGFDAGRNTSRGSRRYNSPGTSAASRALHAPGTSKST